MMGPIAGGIFSVAADDNRDDERGLAIGGAGARSLQGAARDNALFLMVIAIGAAQVLFGVLRLGRLTRFVSFS